MKKRRIPKQTSGTLKDLILSLLQKDPNKRIPFGKLKFFSLLDSSGCYWSKFCCYCRDEKRAAAKYCGTYLQVALGD